jgi:hypothetical protein
MPQGGKCGRPSKVWRTHEKEVWNLCLCLVLCEPRMTDGDEGDQAWPASRARQTRQT